MKRVKPIFVIGCPRSGNTLLGAILNKHPKFFILFEANLFSGGYRKFWYYVTKLKMNPDQAFEKVILQRYHHYNEKFGIVGQDIESIVKQTEPSWSCMLNKYMGLLMRKSGKKSAIIWGDKTPHHVGYIRHIQDAYPKARFLYIYRDPRSVVTSLTNPSFPHASSDSLINAHIVHQFLDAYEKQKKFTNTKQTLEIKYEDLVTDPTASIREICSFLEVEYYDYLLEEAPQNIRNIIGWPKNKGWGKIVPQRSSRDWNLSATTIAYLDEYIHHLGYGHSHTKHSRSSKDLIAARFYLLPFITTYRVLKTFWRRKYPDFPFFLQKYPDGQQIFHWIKHWRKNSR